MRPPRFTIASLLLFIVFLGVGIAALRALRSSGRTPGSRSHWLLTVAVLGAIYRRGQRCAFWVGFACCGWVYWLLARTWVQAQAGPYLLTTAVLEILYEPFDPHSPSVVILPPPTQVSPPVPPSVEVIVPSPVPLDIPQPPMQVGTGGPMPGGSGMMGGMGGGIPGPGPSRWAIWTEPDDSTGEGESIGNVSLDSPQTFRRIGHCLFCVILAFAGGILTRRLYLTRDEPETREVR